jgi:hypothetical protein
MTKIPKRTPLPVLWMWRWRRSEAEDSRFQTPQQKGEYRNGLSADHILAAVGGDEPQALFTRMAKYPLKNWGGPIIFPESMCISDAERFFQSRESAWTTHRESLRAKT